MEEVGGFLDKELLKGYLGHRRVVGWDCIIDGTWLLSLSQFSPVTPFQLGSSLSGKKS